MTRCPAALLCLALGACARPPVAAPPASVPPAAPAPARQATQAGADLGRQCSRLGPAFPDYPEPPPPRPRDGWPRIEPKPPIFGCLDKSIIRRVFRQQREELVCCAQALPVGAGPLKVVVRFRIDERGRVDDVTVAPQAASPPERALERCLATVVSSWRWRPGGWGSILVSYPLRFGA
jgi:hypothetical protein